MAILQVMSTSAPQWFRRRPDPFQSLFARAIVTFIAVVHAMFFLVALATLKFPDLMIGLGFPVLAAFLWIAYAPIPAAPGRSFGGGVLVARVELDRDEIMLLDVPIRWNNWPMFRMGHLLVTSRRIVRSPSYSVRDERSEIRLNDLVRIESYKSPPGIAAWFSEGGSIDLVGDSSSLRVRPTPGFSWMGGYSVHALERDIRDALDRGGWKSQEPDPGGF